MRTPPEDAPGEATFQAIERARKRLILRHTLEGGIVATLMTSAILLATQIAGRRPLPVVLMTAVAAFVLVPVWIAARAGSRHARVAASCVDQGIPGSRNLIVTAQELLQNPERTAAWMRVRVLSDADRLVHEQPGQAIVPLRGNGAAMAAAAALFLCTLWMPSSIRRTHLAPLAPDSAPAARQVGAIVVVLRPPAHTNLPLQTLTDPERIGAVEGTVARLSIARPLPTTTARFLKMPLQLRRDSPDAASSFAELTLVESGYLAVEGTNRAPTLIPVAVTPDRVPAVRVEDPGRDLLVAAGNANVPIHATATDDFGIAMMSLRYTKVSGSGEQYEFIEGEAPLDTVRTDPRAWQGSGSFALGRLGLQRGDSLVYRVVARDARPGERGFSSSDMFFIEVAGPGQVALEGFEMPPDRERHALSQQMIVLKIQRLRAREKQLPDEALSAETTAIAAEQRAVKGNFVFLTGGHVEDEEEEAEGSHEIQEGRLQNTAHREITSAIAHMTRVEQALASMDTAGALAQARLAVAALQRAFGRNRYLLRALPARSRIDPSRRLTGSLDEASGTTRNVPPVAAAREARAMEDLLGAMVAVHTRVTGGTATSTAVPPQQLLEQALTIDADSPDWPTIASHLAAFANTSSSGTESAGVQHLEAAISALVARVRAVASRQGVTFSAPDPLRGAWVEEARRR